MSLKTLLVCLTTEEHAETLVKFAAGLARKSDAYLIGLHTIESLLIYPDIAMHVPEPAFAAFNESQREASNAIEAIFRKHTDDEDFSSEWRLLRAETASAADQMVECARAADLVIMAREDKDNDRMDQGNTPTKVIRYSGRPVIVVPPGYEGPVPGTNIVLGWIDTREATRAAHDLVGMADDGAAIQIVQVGERIGNTLQDSDAIDLAQMFDRHGFKAELRTVAKGEKDIADVLNQHAFDLGADMIVAGAFSHGWAYHMVVGAATPDLLQQAQLPVMFSR